MRIKVLFAVRMFLAALFLFGLPSDMSATKLDPVFGQSTPFDNDGDTLPDEFDPDDDNDGFMDMDDPEPMNPAVPGTGEVPAEPPGNVVLDSDGDSLPDEFDPDDDNDGVMDQEDPEPLNPDVPGSQPAPDPSPTVEVVPSPPVNSPPPANPDPANGVPPADSSPDEPMAETPSEATVPVVTSLPSTGIGVPSHRLLAELLLLLAVASLGLLGIHQRTIAPE